MDFGIGRYRNFERVALDEAFDQFGRALIALRVRFERATDFGRVAA